MSKKYMKEINRQAINTASMTVIAKGYRENARNKVKAK